jgi:hypothetical protein
LIDAEVDGATELLSLIDQYGEIEVKEEW